MYDWDEKPELNITPLVDVMLVLLAIMMVMAPTIVYEEFINLPSGSNKNPIESKRTIEIRIDKDRKIYLNREKISFKNFQDNFLLYTQKRDFRSDAVVLISADESLKYSTIMTILKSVKISGFTQVSLATDG